MIDAMGWILTTLAVLVGGGILILWIGFLFVCSWASSDHGPGDPPLLARQDDDE